MKFAKNRMYVESYTKCPNCGILIFEDTPSAATITVVDTKYCSAWCVEWETQRTARQKAERSEG